MLLRVFILLIFTAFSYTTHAQLPALRQKMEAIIAGKQAHIGISMLAIEDKDTLSINAAHHYPMQSVFKFHLALLVLHKADQGKLSLTQRIHIKQASLAKKSWSPLRDEHTAPEFDLTIKELLSYTVSQSDNNGCDILFGLVGGPAALNNYIHTLGVKDINIVANEAQMHAAWDVQYNNWTTPIAATQLLQKFQAGKILSENSKTLLWQLMATGVKSNRLKGLLPADTDVAHKSGTSDTNEQHLTAAFNDIGIITLPNGKHIAMAVFVSDSKEDDATNQRIISEIAKAAWDHYSLTHMN
ncbi:class A beta-lactamase, subclass A2 [Chitinophaga sp. GbtcB8]|uniref:class A beta-lactamase, subclass A2 n=1 Tax=Chitinophaga sp. GbtcB8 TaxID=2824753 RepID=UPI001C2FBE36|nr:class A beta-lactamase, subclass A2 [Chitinophaga sp. GbtcB8]